MGCLNSSDSPWSSSLLYIIKVGLRLEQDKLILWNFWVPFKDFFHLKELSLELQRHISDRNAFDSDTATESDYNSASGFGDFKISPEKIRNLSAPVVKMPTPENFNREPQADSLTISNLGEGCQKISLDQSRTSTKSSSSVLSDDYHSSASHSVSLDF